VQRVFVAGGSGGQMDHHANGIVSCSSNLHKREPDQRYLQRPLMKARSKGAGQ
jgi:hypothetical protein